MTRNTARHLRIESLNNQRRENAKVVSDFSLGEQLIVREAPNGLIHKIDPEGQEIPWPDHPISQGLADELRIFLCGPEPSIIRAREFTQKVLDEAPSVAYVALYCNGKKVGSQNRLPAPLAE